jgi:hypothetical protein
MIRMELMFSMPLKPPWMLNAPFFDLRTVRQDTAPDADRFWPVMNPTLPTFLATASTFGLEADLGRSACPGKGLVAPRPDPHGIGGAGNFVDAILQAFARGQKDRQHEDAPENSEAVSAKPCAGAAC